MAEAALSAARDFRAGLDSRKGGAPDRDGCRRLIDGMRDEWAGPHAQMRDQEDLYYSAYKISLPKDVEQEGPTYVYTWKAAQQVMQAEGMFAGKKATVNLAAANTRSDSAKQRVELLQNHVTRGFDRLEQQSGEMTFGMVQQDVLKFGRGIDCLEPDPRRIGKYGKSMDDFAEPGAYRKDRRRFIDRMGERGGRLPMNLRHVSPLDCMYREDAERGGVSSVIERRDRYVADVMEDPRYKDSAALEWVFKEYYNSGTRDPYQAGAQKVSVWTIQDRDWTTQFVTPPLRAPSSQWARPESVPIDAFTVSQDIGAIAYQSRNPIGQPWYTVTKGLRTSSSDSARSLVGIYWHASSLIRNLDWLLTVQANALKDQAFAPWVFIRGMPTVNGQQMPLLVDPQKRRIRIARGNGYITELDPGTIQQLIATAPPELLPMVENIRRETNLLMIPEAMFDISQSSSGYEYNSMRNSVESRMSPIIEGIKMAMAQRVDLYVAELLWMGEDISVTTVEGDHLVQTYTFRPAEYRDLEVTLDTDLQLPKPEDNMADAQVAAFVVEKRLLDVARARERYMQITNSDEVDRDIALDDYKRSPKVAEWVIDKAATEAGITLEQQAAEAQGGVDTQQLLNTNPALLAQLAQQAQPGSPGYAQIMAAAQQAGMTPPPAASPQAAPPEDTLLPPVQPPNAPIPMGPPAGQMQATPGGPHLAGGFGG